MIVIEPVKPIPPAEEGSAWEWLYDVSCRSGAVQRKGSIARVIERTGMAPHGEIMYGGYDLLIHTGDRTIIWATFEHCISGGLLRRVGGR